MSVEPNSPGSSGDSSPAESSAAPAAARPKSRRRFLRYSLSTLFAIMTLSVLVAYQGTVWRQEMEDEEAAIGELLRRGAEVNLMKPDDYTLFAQRDSYKDPRPPLWFRKLVHKENFLNAHHVRIPGADVMPEPGIYQDGQWTFPPGPTVLRAPCNPTEDVFRLLGKLRGLSTLTINGSQIDEDGFRWLRGAQCLQLVELIGPSVTGSGIKYLKNCPLKNIRIFSTAISLEGMQAIGVCRHLEILSIDSDSVTDEGVRQLQMCAALERLTLDCPLLGDGACQALGNLAQLKHLSLNGKKITGVGFASWKQSPLLELSLEGCAVTVEGMKAINGLHHLTYLKVKNCGVGSDGVAQLSGLNALKTFNFDHNVLTASDVAGLRERLPQLTISGGGAAGGGAARSGRGGGGGPVGGRGGGGAAGGGGRGGGK